MVPSFRYLGRYLSQDASDSVAISMNIKKTQARWGRLYRVLSAEGATPRVMARFYLAIVQSVLLYGSESWVLSTRDSKRLERFHARCARYMSHRHLRQLPDGSWSHPHTAAILEICGLSPISTYIAKRKTTLLHNYVQPSCALYRICLQSASSVAGRQRLVWWNS
jgi:hypothetical protein